MSTRQPLHRSVLELVDWYCAKSTMSQADKTELKSRLSTIPDLGDVVPRSNFKESLRVYHDYLLFVNDFVLQPCGGYRHRWCHYYIQMTNDPLSRDAAISYAARHGVESSSRTDYRNNIEGRDLDEKWLIKEINQYRQIHETDYL